MTLRFKSIDPREAEQHCEELLKTAHAAGLFLRPIWKLLHHLPMYVSAPRGALPVAEDQSKRLVNLPSSPQLLQ